MRFFWILGSILASATGAYFGRPLVHENADAVTVMITVMTVFAGFLVAIISILGDPAMIPKGSWRNAQAALPKVEASLIRHSYLFYCYLVAIGLLFVGVLLQGGKSDHGDHVTTTQRIVETGYLFFSILSFLFTLSLPSALSRVQLDRTRGEIAQRRAGDGIVDPEP